ncbi:MAG: CoA transferase subunit B [Candidatus Marinimicrobia bacterium]|nr:CoA transferase subunit B [Candidatus Neomarinimicrobiota bacterium]
MNTTERVGWSRIEMAQKAALDIPDGSYVNLGIGMPELIADHVPPGIEVIYHTENGLLGMGPVPEPGQEDVELINAGKKYVTAIKGACFFHHADSFTMIRGGHLDISILGALQVCEKGDLANWSTGKPGAIPAVGGAMDLVAGVKNVWVITDHNTKDGQFKLVNNCSFPLTGKGVVDRVYTNLAIIEITEEGLKVREMAPGITFEYLQEKTEPKLIQ